MRLVLAILLAVGLVGFNPATAQADPTDVPINVGSDAYAIDNTGQITSNSEFLYDSAKGENADDAYQIAYRGTLDMTKVWELYNTFFKPLWMWSNNNDQARWNMKTFSGEWDISFTVDNTVVSANPSFVSCDAVQAEMDRQNAPSKFGEIMRCETTSYDATTGTYQAHFKLKHADGTKVTGADLDKAEYQPAKLVLTTPPHALYVPQSKFVAGKTFSMTNPTVTGTMTMDHFYVGMPLRFNDTSSPVTLTMVHTYDAKFTFASRDTNRQLPQQVADLTPSPATMLREGDIVTAPTLPQTSVVDGQGVWHFDGWNMQQATVADSDIEFVGYWKYIVNPDAIFSASYEYVSTDGSSLPKAVLNTLPAASTVTQGDTITPPAPTPATFAISVIFDGKKTVTTWTFKGWAPATAVVDGADITFTGTWGKTVTQERLSNQNDNRNTKPKFLPKTGR